MSTYVCIGFVREIPETVRILFGHLCWVNLYRRFLAWNDPHGEHTSCMHAVTPTKVHMYVSKYFCAKLKTKVHFNLYFLLQSVRTVLKSLCY
jgi:hypothetical protein